ncbi:MAG: GNAT family N-acetyltransferase, partial [Planctomycetota bacterium]
MTTFIPVRTSAVIARVVRLAECIWQQHYTPIIGPAQVAYMLDRFQSPAAIAAQIAAGVDYHLLLHDGQDAGYCAWQQEKDELFLSKLYVVPELRGCGLARSAVSAAEQVARDHALARIRLNVNRHNAGAIAAYQHLGFVIRREICADIGGGFVMDDYVMEREVVYGEADLVVGLTS